MTRIDVNALRAYLHASLKRWRHGFLKAVNQAPLGANQQATFSLGKLRAFPQFLFTKAYRHHPRVSLVLLSALVFGIGLLILRPYESQLRANLALRPAQWAHLHSLVSAINPNEVATVTQFTHEDMKALHAMGISRGIQPNSFLLTSTAPVTISIQSNGIAFSAFMAMLEQMRKTWHIYPADIKVQSTSVPGTVNVTGSLMQYPTVSSPPHKTGEGR